MRARAARLAFAALALAVVAGGAAGCGSNGGGHPSRSEVMKAIEGQGTSRAAARCATNQLFKTFSDEELSRLLHRLHQITRSGGSADDLSGPLRTKLNKALAPCAPG